MSVMERANRHFLWIIFYVWLIDCTKSIFPYYLYRKNWTNKVQIKDRHDANENNKTWSSYDEDEQKQKPFSLSNQSKLNKYLNPNLTFLYINSDNQPTYSNKYGNRIMKKPKKGNSTIERSHLEIHIFYHSIDQSYTKTKPINITEIAI